MGHFEGLDFDGLSRDVAKKLKGAFDNGQFDEIGVLVNGALQNVGGDSRVAIHLRFVLERLDCSPTDREERVIRPLGHVAVTATYSDNAEEERSFLISPSFVGNPLPCETCKGTGMQLEKLNSATADQPFNPTQRKLP